MLNTLKKIYDYPFSKYVLLALPIVVFLFPLLLTGRKIALGDVDYNFQLAEAFRRTVLHYHQFPWWDPWVAGGTPLYANAQFGLFSLQSVFVLLFGAAVGFKIAIVGYYLIGFYGLRHLFTRCFSTPTPRATLLAYVWSFGTFLSYRVAGGHFTFLLVQYFPWALYFYFRRHEGRNWLYLALVLALMVLSAPHYMTIMSFVVLASFVVFESITIKTTKNKLSVALSLSKRDFVIYAKVFGIVFLLSAHRLYYAFKYLSDYPRNQLIYREVFQSVPLGLRAIMWPFNQVNNAPPLKVWTWLEVSAYIGITTFIAFLLVLGMAIYRRKKERVAVSANFTYPVYLLLFLMALFFVMALGEFSKFAPFYIFRRLPLLGAMRVSPRWFAWVSLLMLFVIAAYKRLKYERVINALLLVACFDLFFVSRPLIYQTYKFNTRQVRSSYAAFEQQANWKTAPPRAPYDRNLLEATDNNYGQVIADDPLIDTRFMPTLRCDVDDGCPFVSNNGQVVSWSPNKIIIKRLSPGPITLNMNPGKGWLINNKYVFSGLKTVDPSQQFIINDPGDTITAQYAPKFSLGWLKSKF